MGLLIRLIMLTKYNNVQAITAQRLKTGLEFFDTVINGGIPLNFSLVFSGQPGCGKSTLLSQIVKTFSDTNKRVLYVAGEEGADIIKSRMQRIGQLNTENILFYEADIVYSDDLIRIMAEHKIDLLAVDSIQFIRHRAVKAENRSMLQASIDLCNEQRKNRSFTFVSVCQSNKNGKPKGDNRIIHQFDIVALMQRHPDSTSLRQFSIEKSRFGDEGARNFVVGVNGATDVPVMPEGTSEGLIIEDGEPSNRFYLGILALVIGMIIFSIAFLNY